MNAPCKDCERRTLGCHSTCEEYKAYDAKNAERRDKNFEDGKLNQAQVERFINKDKTRKASWQRHNRR